MRERPSVPKVGREEEERDTPLSFMAQVIQAAELEPRGPRRVAKKSLGRRREQLPERAVEPAPEPEERTQLHLLLARADDQGAVFDRGPQLESVLDAPRPSLGESQRFLFDAGGEPNDLPAQRWALVVPEGRRGERLLAVIQPLVRRRAEQQGLAVSALKVFRVKPGMDEKAAAAWHTRVLQAMPLREQPRYLLLLGDADEISFELQRHLAVDRFVGRLAFPEESGFEAYVEKVLRAELEPSKAEKARALFFTAHDGSSATNVGYQCLVAPSLERCREATEVGDFPASEVVEVGSRTRWSGELLLREAAHASPGVLFTLSHGLGPSPAGWASPEEQRQRQGTMSLGAGQELPPEAVSKRAFLPGGIWFNFACFSAGTPTGSAYSPWLKRLQSDGQGSEGLDAVLASAPADRRPFVAALPQAALANPEGPLAVIGHVDLAWTYAFQERTGQNHALRFVGVMQELLKHRRAGVALGALTRFVSVVNADLTAGYQADAVKRAQRAGSPEAMALAHLWMTRHDLAGHVLLGDPAARLALKTHEASKPARRSDFGALE